MKSTYLACIAAVLLAACDQAPSDPNKYDLAVPAERREEAAEFMVRLCEASNPHSDEEPEDMIKEAWRATLHLYGERTLGRNALSNSGGYVFVPWPQEAHDAE